MSTISRVIGWLSADASVPRWAVCLGVLAGLIVAAEVATWVVLWLEQRKFDRENRE